MPGPATDGDAAAQARHLHRLKAISQLYAKSSFTFLPNRAHFDLYVQG